MAEEKKISVIAGNKSLKRKTKDLTGLRFGRLVVISFEGYENSKATWLCRCDCGKIQIKFAEYLKNGDASSCGCILKERWLTHGLSNHRIFSIWTGMIQRCTNPKAAGYKDYGGRGIKVCERWLNSVETFWEDTKREYASNLTLDRIDTNGDYGPSNYRWATKKEQQNNRRDNVRLTVGTITASVEEWSKISGTVKQTIVTRFYRGYSHEECVYGKKVEKWN